MERTIKLSQDIPIEQILEKYEYEIFNSALDSMRSNYKNLNGDDINVVTIQTQSISYNIALTQGKFELWLTKCIEFFEKREEYEKCQECVDILKYLQHNNIKIKGN
jgi:hypothetical protein